MNTPKWATMTLEEVQRAWIWGQLTEEEVDAFIEAWNKDRTKFTTARRGLNSITLRERED